MKKYFIAGLALILPLTVTIIVFLFIVDLLTDPFVDIVKHLFLAFQDQLGPLYKHPKLLLFVGRITVLVFMFLSILLLGVLGRHILFRYLQNTLTAIVERIPVVRRIYRITREMTKSVLGSDKKPFGKPIYYPFPHMQSVAIGFETGPVPKAAEQPDRELTTIFIPTAPHPISGFVLIARKDLVNSVDIRAEEVLKFLVSCGTYTPGEPE